MRNFLVASFLLLLSCSSKKTTTYFLGYPNKLEYKGHLTNNKEESVFEFFDAKGKRVSAGSYVNGFRDGNWYYNVDDSLIEIKWAHHKDKNLGFETNMFATGDTIYYGDYNTKIDYTVGNGKISVGVAINAPFRDSVAKIGYRKVSEEELRSINYTIKSFDSTQIQDIKIYSFNATNDDEQKRIYLNVAFGNIGNKDIQITVISNGGVKKAYNDIFFEAVLTNFFLDSQRLHFPYK